MTGNSAPVEMIAGKKVVDTEKYKYHILVGCFFGFFFDNVDMSITSIGLPILMKAFDIGIVEGGLIGTSMLIGAAVGAWFWGPFTDKVGRRKAYIVCLCWYTVATLACAACNTLVPFLVCRFACGLALGGAWIIGVAYLSDFFPEKQRGLAICAVQSSSVLGMILVAFVVGTIVPTYSWHVMFLIAVLAVPVIFYFLWLPESPVWLKAHYAEEAAKGDATAPLKKTSLAEILKIPVFRKALIMASLLVVAIQVGYWGANQWLPTYLTSERGLSIEAMAAITSAMYAGAFTGYYILGWMSGKIGNRKTYIIASVYTTLCLLGYIFLSNDSNVWVFAALFGLGSCGMFGLLGAYVSEVVPKDVRARGLGVVWSIGRLAAAAAPISLGALATVSSLGVCIGLVSAFYVLAFIVSLFMRETKGNSLEDVTIGDMKAV